MTDIQFELAAEKWQSTQRRIKPGTLMIAMSFSTPISSLPAPDKDNMTLTTALNALLGIDWRARNIQYYPPITNTK